MREWLTRLVARLDAWIAAAWIADERASRPPTVPAHTAHREHEAHLHELADRARRRSRPPAVTGNITDLFDESTRPTRPAIRPPANRGKPS